MSPIILEPVLEQDLEQFKKDLQASFSLVLDEMPEYAQGDLPIPPDEDIEKSYKAPNAQAFHFVSQGEKVGGAILNINENTQKNSLDFLFISVSKIGQGLGKKAWESIEKAFPKTQIWETHTPYFEKRNIHFYVNKCGFKIVEFYHKNNPDPHTGESDDFFRFEKTMYNS